jgi:hypothetical protein
MTYNIIVVTDDRPCAVFVTTPRYVARPGVISLSSSQSSAEQLCGTRTRPWVFEARAGQRINVSLIDFTSSAADKQEARQSSRASTCQDEYGYIVDKQASAVNNRVNRSICGHAGLSQLKNVFLSTSNAIELVMTSVGDKEFFYLIRVEGKWILIIRKSNPNINICFSMTRV